MVIQEYGKKARKLHEYAEIEGFWDIGLIWVDIVVK
jgi:hypothetical protein